MVKTNLKRMVTYARKFRSTFYAVLLLVLAANVNMQAQCSLACKSEINISISEDNVFNAADCSIMITADMVLNGEMSSCPGRALDDFLITIRLEDGTTPAHQMPMPYEWADAGSLIHQRISISIMDPTTGNSCWGYANIEDKLAPDVRCQDQYLDIPCCEPIDERYDPDDSCVDECSEITWRLLDQQTVKNNCTTNNLGDDILKEITRKFVAVDEWGMQSEDTLTQVLRVNRKQIEDPNVLICPPSFRDDEAIQCDDLPDSTIVFKGVEVPAPIPMSKGGGGVPVIFNAPYNIALTAAAAAITMDFYDLDSYYLELYPLNAGDSLTAAIFEQCGIGVRYEDRLLPSNCGYKLIRTWYISEWACPSEIEETCVQTFEIIDTEGPTLVQGVSDFEGTTNGYTCSGSIYIPAPIYNDDCSGVKHIDLTYPGGFINDFQSSVVDLPFGVDTLIFVAYDECHNATSTPDTVIVNVWDKTPPVAICDEHTVVSLSTDGYAEIPAEVFDDGSYDDCGIDSIRVMKMDPDLCGLGQDTIFRKTVTFCCAEDNVMVIMRVWDKQGNYNDCMFQVEVQDKVEPKILNCPNDIMVSCGLNFPISEPELSELFGTLVAHPDSVKTYSFTGSGTDASNFIASYFGDQMKTFPSGADAIVFSIWDGQYIDNCGASVSVDNVDKRNQCGIGNIERTFSLMNTDGVVVDKCTQTIQVKPITPFDFETIILPDSIVDVNACGNPDDYGPDVTGWPTIPSGACDLVGFNYKDQVFPFNDSDTDDACFKILRTWKFIDWCSFDGATNQPYPMPPFLQIIKVTDENAPEFLFTCEERSECTYDIECSSGYIELLKSALDVDGCTAPENLRWQAQVFIDVKADTNRIDTLFTGTGSLANASAHYPVGKHKVVWTYWDRCGNLTSCEQPFHIKNCKAPTPYCIDGIAIDLMPVDTNGDGDIDAGMVELWASDFDLGSSHPCGYDVIMSFSEDVDDQVRTFDCSFAEDIVVNIYSSVIVGEGEHADTIQAYCVTSLSIQDNMNACSGRGTITQAALVSGLIATETNRKVSDANVELQGSELPIAMTNTDGGYAFPDMPMGGAYTVTPTKNVEPINGVSTLDLVLIQKHILGLTNLDSPYKQIAADINKDQRISGTDLVELRKLILGNVDEYENNNSWRFVDDSYTFGNPNDALQEQIPEEYEIISLENDMLIDFTAVKIGDVNNSVTLSNYASTEVRSSNKLVMSVPSTVSGSEIIVPFKVTEGQEISGFQFTLDFSETNMKFVSTKDGAVNLDETNIGLRYVEKGIVTFSWNSSDTEIFNEGETLFNLIFTSNNPKVGALEINSNVTEAQAYNSSNEVMPVSLTIESESSKNDLTFTLNQNSPNPFTDATTISFVLPSAMNATLSITDITGKLVREYKGDWARGLNSIELSHDEINTAGILYYTLKTDSFSDTKRMVLIK